MLWRKTHKATGRGMSGNQVGGKEKPKEPVCRVHIACLHHQTDSKGTTGLQGQSYIKPQKPRVAIVFTTWVKITMCTDRKPCKNSDVVAHTWTKWSSTKRSTKDAQLTNNTCSRSWGFYSLHLKFFCFVSGTSLFAQGTFTTIKTGQYKHYYYHYLFE